MKEYIYKYETHCLTKEISWCGLSYAFELVDAYYRAGYSGIVITDHFFNGFCRVNALIDWHLRVRFFHAGYIKAKKHAEKYDGFSVFFGWEFNDHGTEFLTYGLDVNFLYNNPDLLSWSTERYLNEVHKAGGFIIHAHPFRKWDYIGVLKYYPKQIDAVEVVNGGNYRANEVKFDVLALEYARKLGLPGTKGTDCHDIREIKGDGILLKNKVQHFDELISAIKEGDFA